METYRIEIKVYRDKESMGQTQVVTTLWEDETPLTSLKQVRETLDKWRENYYFLGIKVWEYKCFDPEGIEFRF